MPFFGPLKLSESQAQSDPNYVNQLGKMLAQRFPGATGFTAYPGQSGGGTGALGFTYNSPPNSGVLEGIKAVSPESLTSLLTGIGAPSNVEELIGRTQPVNLPSIETDILSGIAGPGAQSPFAQAQAAAAAAANQQVQIGGTRGSRGPVVPGMVPESGGGSSDSAGGVGEGGGGVSGGTGTGTGGAESGASGMGGGEGAVDDGGGVSGGPGAGGPGSGSGDDSDAGGPGGGEDGGGGGGAGGGSGDSVICTHLHKHGYMSDAVYAADARFGQTLPSHVYRGYRTWADSVVRLMEKHPSLTRIVAWIARPWTVHMAFRMGVGDRDSMVGAVIMRVGWKICSVIGKRSVQTRESVPQV